MGDKNRQTKHFREALAIMLAQRQGDRCARCGELFSLADEVYAFTDIDHVTPLSMGGGWHPDNLQLLHRLCHVAKTTEETIAGNKRRAAARRAAQGAV